MRVLKRNGTLEDVKFDKVTERLRKLSDGLDVSCELIAQKVLSEIQDGISTSKLDEISADVAIAMTDKPDYGVLASRILVSNMHKNCGKEHERDYLFDYFGLKTLQKTYLAPGETPQDLWTRVAKQVSSESDFEDTYQALSTKKYIHATPTLFNSGTPRPQLASCFLVAMKDDSIEGIYDTKKEMAMISKYAGGIGLHVHNIRAKGSRIIGNNGKSDGLLPMLRTVNADARYVNQGGRRKGAVAVYLEPWHADILDFLELRLNQGDEESRCRDLFTAIWMPDLFMHRLESSPDATWSLFCPNEAPGLSDVYGSEFEELYERYESEGRARAKIPIQTIWKAILKSQVETGTPYMLYKDSCNRKSNQKNIGTIKSSNLCVAPETPILTREGYRKISDLRDQQIEVWNGYEWSMVTIRKTSDSSELVRVEIDTGTFVECTPDHKFWIKPGYANKPVEVRAKDLVPGDKLIKWDSRPIELPEIMKYPYTHGFFCGDGTYNNNRPMVSLYGSKKNLINHLNIRTTSGNEDATGRINCMLPHDLDAKFFVPMNHTIKSRLEWLAGLIDADGTVLSSGHIQIASINKQFLHDIFLMLHTLGVQSRITLAHGSMQRELPDGNGGTRLFDCQPLWRLCISHTFVNRLIDLGLVTYRAIVKTHDGNRCAHWFAKVVSVSVTGRISETFCFTEPKRHMGVFNGILTGQCTEILEVSTPDETAVCNLASIALPSFVDQGFDFNELHRVTRLIVRNLNNVIDRGFYPVEEARRSNLRLRPIGIGVQGLADVFAMLKLPFDSQEARTLNKMIFEHIYFAALSESNALAKKFGRYDGFDGSPAANGILQFDMWSGSETTIKTWDWLSDEIKQFGLRNSLLIAPMPTATTSQILGFNECFEPFTSNMYLRRTLAGEFTVINKYLVKELRARGLWNRQIKDRIVRNGGSVQGIPGVPEDIQNIYKTVWEISPRVIIDMARDRGAFIDQSQSMNLFVEDPTNAKLSSIHMYAWRQGLKTGMYYLRTRPKAKPIQFSLEPECVMCSA